MLKRHTTLFLLLALFFQCNAAFATAGFKGSGGGGLPETPLAIIHGGTSSTTAPTARTALSAAASGVNTDITSANAMTSANTLATIGTVTTGVWNATALVAAYLPASTAYINAANSWSVDQVPNGAGTINFGSAALPWLSIYLGTAATNNQHITSAVTTAARTFTFPNANSNSVIPDTGAANNFLTAISAGGVISKSQPAFPNISGQATTAQMPTLTNTHLFVGSAGNVPTDVALSGDATLANTGVITLKNTGPGALSFTNSSITLDVQGRVTAASSGSGGAAGSIVYGGMSATQRAIPTTGTLTGDYAQVGDYITTGAITCNRCRLKVLGNVTITALDAWTINTELPGGIGAPGLANTSIGGFGTGLGAGAGGIPTIGPGPTNALQGGGGGGFGGSGGAGGSGVAGVLGGAGGSTYFTEHNLMGSSGGGGVKTTTSGGAGGAGGGGLYIEATGNVAVNAGITATGGAGTAGGSGTDGGGGGGSGGGVDIRCNGTFTLAAATTISVVGGAGGNGGNLTSAGAGGGGGGGYVFVRSGGAATVTGTVTVTGGAAGTGTTSAATAGSAGASSIVGGATYPVRSAP